MPTISIKKDGNILAGCKIKNEKFYSVYNIFGIIEAMFEGYNKGALTKDINDDICTAVRMLMWGYHNHHGFSKHVYISEETDKILVDKYNYHIKSSDNAKFTISLDKEEIESWGKEDGFNAYINLDDKTILCNVVEKRDWSECGRLDYTMSETELNLNYFNIIDTKDIKEFVLNNLEKYIRYTPDLSGSYFIKRYI